MRTMVDIFFEVSKVDLNSIPERVIFRVMICILLTHVYNVLLNHDLVCSLKVDTVAEEALQVGTVRPR